MDLRRAVAERLGFQTAQASPPAYGPQSNASVKNAVRHLKGLTRASMLALQERIQGEVPVDHLSLIHI
eukprot:5239693-Alexandrium_andersonii.AAC.1